MTDFTLWDLVRNLLLAARWTLLLSAIAFAGGGIVGLALLLIRIGGNKWGRTAVMLYVELFQSTPLLLQLFLVYFGLPKLGIDVSAWLATAVCLTLYSSAFLTDIWRGSVEAKVPRPHSPCTASTAWGGITPPTRSRWAVIRIAIRRFSSRRIPTIWFSTERFLTLPLQRMFITKSKWPLR
jgi:polar amino acid transport system permease protein